MGRHQFSDEVASPETINLSNTSKGLISCSPYFPTKVEVCKVEICEVEVCKVEIFDFLPYSQKWATKSKQAIQKVTFERLVFNDF